MDNEKNFETFLFIGLNNFIISIKTKDNLETIHEKEINFKNVSSVFNSDKLSDFLNQNIFKIEKSLNFFIKDINIILEHEEFLPIQVSIKKNNYGNLISKNDIIYSLNELQNHCKKTLAEKKIVHMLIDEYTIDDKTYSNFVPNLSCKNFSLNVRFICLPNYIIDNLEKILKKYQIVIHRIVEINYLNDFFKDNGKDIFFNAKQIILGCNENEVKLLEKSRKNEGFFEKFFNFFN
tara:strand:+ start:832 stop:1536 length:705 start_codon:yes stop_codon:yes gene_type:complete